MRTYHWISPLHVIWTVSKLAYRIWVILIANKKSEKKKERRRVKKTSRRPMFSTSITIVSTSLQRFSTAGRNISLYPPVHWPHGVTLRCPDVKLNVANSGLQTTRFNAANVTTTMDTIEPNLMVEQLAHLLPIRQIPGSGIDRLDVSFLALLSLFGQMSLARTASFLTICNSHSLSYRQHR
jgi:hypothetical protein